MNYVHVILKLVPKKDHDHSANDNQQKESTFEIACSILKQNSKNDLKEFLFKALTITADNFQRSTFYTAIN